MTKLSRRDFLRIASAAAGSAALAALAGCMPNTRQETASEPATEIAPTETPPAPDPSPSPTPTPVPPTPTEAVPITPTPPVSQIDETSGLLGNENRPGFYIRYYKLFEPVDVEAWTLPIEGLVEQPQKLDFDEMLSLPKMDQTSRMKCVEGWSVAAVWEGFAPQVLVDLVGPKPEATWVHFHSADDYYESVELPELLMDRVIFAYGMNGALLTPEHGSPLRLIIPFKYAYKGPKVITRIVFANQPLRGLWPTLGPYTEDGQIVPGVDWALDLDTYRTFDKMGELFYEEGLESQGS